MLVDASGRDGFMASRYGERRRIPNLGKVALFTHFRGARREAGLAEGNIRIYAFKEGWCWWIPFSNDVTSVGAVLHARAVKDFAGTPEELFESMVRRCRGVHEHLGQAERITPVHRAANFAYTNMPIVGDRYLCVGDAIAFIDPIFSSGVFIAMRTGELAAQAPQARGEAGIRLDAGDRTGRGIGGIAHRCLLLASAEPRLRPRLRA